MFDTIAPRYDLVNRIITLGFDVAWRKRTVRALQLDAGSLVADLACGTGDLCRELERLGHTAIGLDLSLGMLHAARTGAPLVQADILSTPLPDSALDGVTCGFALRNLVDLECFFAELARIVRPGARVALLEVAEPSNALLRFGHRWYFGRVVPWIGGVLSDRGAYEYLPRSVEYLPTAGEICRRLSSAGFDPVEQLRLSAGLAQLFTATRSSP